MKDRLLHFHKWLFSHEKVFAIDHPSIIDAYITFVLESEVDPLDYTQADSKVIIIDEKDVYGQSQENRQS